LMTQISRDVTKARKWFVDHPLESLSLILP
jgi:hypothetical protein